MKISVLCENTTQRESIISEHGFSLYIETDAHKILFDMGQTSAFADNARQMGIALDEVDIAILSHGHYDHSGGIKRFLEINSKASLYVNRAAFGDYYNASGRYIGLDKEIAESDRIILVEDSAEIGENILLASCNGKPKKIVTDSCGLCKREGCSLCPDDFLHEQYLLIEENGKRVLISGCSRTGIHNILDWFSPDILIGGFHFSKLDPNLDTDKKKLIYAAEQMLLTNTAFYTGHCTGELQYDFLKRIMGERLHYISSGDSFTI